MYSIYNFSQFKLFESPDKVKLSDNSFLTKYNKDSLCFGIYNDELYLSNFKESFYNLLRDNNLIKKVSFKISNPEKVFKYSGRIWIFSNVISFYDFPSNKENMKNFINKLNSKIQENFSIKLNIWNDFMIEVNRDEYSELIPIKNYNNSERFDYDIRKHGQIDHTNSPMNKKTKKIDKFGSKARKYPLWFKQTMYKSEGKKKY